MGCCWMKLGRKGVNIERDMWTAVSSGENDLLVASLLMFFPQGPRFTILELVAIRFFVSG